MITIEHMPSDWETMPDVSWSVEDDAAIAANHPCYFTGYDMPNYPMPAILEPTHFIALLWQQPMARFQEREVRKWYLALCFDAKGYFKG